MKDQGGRYSCAYQFYDIFILLFIEMFESSSNIMLSTANLARHLNAPPYQEYTPIAPSYQSIETWIGELPLGVPVVEKSGGVRRLRVLLRREGEGERTGMWLGKGRRGVCRGWIRGLSGRILISERWLWVVLFHGVRQCETSMPLPCVLQEVTSRVLA